MKNKTIISLICLLSLLALILSGCGGASYDTSKGMETAAEESWSEPQAPMEAPMPAPEEAESYSYTEAGFMSDNISSGSVNNTVSQTQKLIYRLYMDIETLDYATSIEEIQYLCSAYDGYVEYSSVSGTQINSSSLRWAQFTLRIPADNLDAFESACGSIGNVYNLSRQTENATATYVDLSARLGALKTEEERLLELLEMADNLESIIALNSRLSEVRYEIESIESSLRNIDALVSYSTVEIWLNEVVETTEPVQVPRSFSDRVSAAFSASTEDFKDSLEDFGVFLLGRAPMALLRIVLTLIPFAVIALVVILIIRKHRRKKAALWQQPPSPGQTPDQSDINEE